MTHPSTVADTLDAAADLLSKPGAWTQKVAAKGATGKATMNLANAVCFCALGAILRSGGGLVGADDYFGSTLNEAGDWWSIGHWNDQPGRTQDEVVAKLREAAAKARGEVQP